VYENKQNMNIMSDEKSDIYVDMKRIWRNIAGFEGQSVLSGAFVAGFLREVAPKTQRSGAPC
jgi:hypothetical protein